MMRRIGLLPLPLQRSSSVGRAPRIYVGEVGGSNPPSHNLVRLVLMGTFHSFERRVMRWNGLLQTGNLAIRVRLSAAPLVGLCVDIV